MLKEQGPELVAHLVVDYQLLLDKGQKSHISLTTSMSLRGRVNSFFCFFFNSEILFSLSFSSSLILFFLFAGRYPSRREKTLRLWGYPEKSRGQQEEEERKKERKKRRTLCENSGQHHPSRRLMPTAIVEVLFGGEREGGRKREREREREKRLINHQNDGDGRER